MLEDLIRPASEAFGLGPGARQFVALFSALGFEESAPVQSYVGHVGGTPVATSQMFLGAGVAGIYVVGTLPDYRGRGFGKALTLAPLHHARALGYRWAILQATEMGHPVYLRLGFREDCKVELYGPPPSPP
ncbi:MAG: GNAT family N-acetyltransferase [Euryarchaeota archaeon]|nr:GNAT family N-acetyltransferase [Euryarchaeota archaeon]